MSERPRSPNTMMSPPSLPHGFNWRLFVNQLAMLDVKIHETIKQIEEALNNGDFSERNPILAAQSFQYFCRIAPDIFFEPCNNMFEKLFFMTQDLCAKKNIKQICIDNELCPREM